MTFTRGARVRRASGQGEGVVVEVHGDFLDVAMPEGVITVHVDDVIPVFATPAEQLAHGSLGDSDVYMLRLQQAFLRHAYQFDPRSGLSNARIEPQPHQVYVAHRVVEKAAPRMILADEVGLGKTVEAGLILKELRARQSIERVLIVTPASLLLQWQHELSSKFNESFSVIDGEAAKFLGRGGDNPFSKQANVLCSLPFASNPKRAEQIIQAGWDLVIFDEAHRVRRTRKSNGDGQATLAYRLADELKDNIHGLLLLTATPIQLHQYELYSLVELVEPGLLRSAEQFEKSRRRIPQLNGLMRELKRWPELEEDERDNVLTKHAGLLSDIGGPAVLRDPDSISRAMDDLTKLHPLAQVLVRNRKSELGIVSERRARRIPVPLDQDFADLYWEISNYLRDRITTAVREKNLAVGFVMVTYQRMLTSSPNTLRTSLLRRIARLKEELDGKRRSVKITAAELDALEDDEEASAALETLDGEAFALELVREEIEMLESLARRLGAIRDAKAQTLLDEILAPIFEKKPDEKVVIFTQFIETQNYLAFALRGNNYKVAIFNGRLTPDEKEAQVKHFRHDAQILISTEAGGEGRNLQFSHLLVNYDLPWNPMKVEQRIGRLDRIGQKKPVMIYNLVYEETIEDRVLSLLENRIKLFEESVGALDPILGDVERDIQAMMLKDVQDMSRGLEAYADDLERRVRDARTTERMMADFILDRASLRRDQAQRLLQEEPMASPANLLAFMERSLEYLGGTLTEHPEGGHVVALSQRLASRLGVRQTTSRGAFPPALALELEDLDFFAFGHDVVDSLIAHVGLLQGGETGARVSRSVPSGLWVEMIYQASSYDPKPRGVLVRHLVGADGEVRSEELRSWDFDDRPGRDAVPDWAAGAVARSKAQWQADFAKIREQLKADLEAARDELIERARRIAGARRDQIDAEITRATAWLESRRVHASEGDRRIMPARQALVVNAYEKRQRLDAQLELDIEALENMHIEVSSKPISAGLVRGAQ